MKTQIFNSYAHFLNREDKTANGVSPEFAEKYPDFEAQNETNSGCWNCSDCRYCRYCSDCSDCRYCSYCSDEKGKNMPDAPKIENSHQAVLAAATATESSLDMGRWHVCETTHCRAGWVVHLAGKAGYELEEKTDTAFAAQVIYKKSSEIEVPLRMFYVNSEESIADMKRCAELKMAATKNAI